MSKLTKLIFSPRLFFYDMLRKKLGKGNPAPSSSMNISLLKVTPGPRILLHSGEGALGAGHLRMWMSTFEKSGIPFAVLTRTKKLFDAVREEFPEVSVAFATSPADVEAVLNEMPLLKAVFYTSNTGNNIHLLRLNEFRHIFIGHGDSNKTASAHKVFRAYDEVWVAGQAHIDRFVQAGFDTGHLKFVKVGRPTLKEAIDMSAEKPWHARFEQPTIMYLPTWEGFNEEQAYTSLPWAGELLSTALSLTKGTALMKLHPGTGTRIKSLASAEEDICRYLSRRGFNAEAIERTVPIEQAIPRANIFVCDISAVVTECLAADAPLFVYQPRSGALQVSESKVALQDFAYVFSSVDELKEAMKDLLENGDRHAARRAEMRQYYMGLDETRADRFIQEMHACIQ